MSLLLGNVYFLQGDYYWAVQDLANMTTASRELRNETAFFGCNRPAKTEMSPLRNVSVRIGILPLAFPTALLVVVVVLLGDVVVRYSP